MSYSRLSHFFIGIILLGVLSGEVVSKPIKVVAITEDFASIAKDIGGDLVDVSSLIKGSRNLHHINPKPSMVMKVKSADLLIRLGMQQDSWIDSLISRISKSKWISGCLSRHPEIGSADRKIKWSARGCS